MLTISQSDHHLHTWSPLAPPTSEDFFDLLQRVQASRLDDQRCNLPSSGMRKTAPKPESQRRLETILSGPGPYPMLSLPGDNVWWSDDDHDDQSEDDPDNSDNDEDISRVYRAHFLQTEHFNFIGHVIGNSDNNSISGETRGNNSISGETRGNNSISGDTRVDTCPMVLSVKYYNDGHVRVVMRLSSSSQHHLIDTSQLNEVITLQAG